LGSGFTFECWVKPKNVEFQQTIAEWNSGGGGVGVHFMHSYAGSGALFANLADSSGNNHIISSAAGILRAGSFQHVALTYDKTSGIASLFYNGAAVATGNLGVFIPQTSYPLYLGTRFSGSGTGSYLNALLDEVSLYNRALAQEEIASIYIAGSAGKYCLAPVVLTQPSDWIVTPGSSVTFLVAARGSIPLSYQWRRNSLDLSGATNASLTINDVEPADAGIYSVRITNILNSIVSSNASLKVNVITVQGNGQTLTNTANSFSGPVTIQLLNFYTNGLIFYTLDGSTPWFLSSLYEGPFVVNESVVIRTLGYSSDFFQAGESDPMAILVVSSFSLSASAGGGGIISRDPDSVSYLSNSVVVVTATPDSGWRFLKWQGDATGTNPIIAVPMSRNKSLQAIFGTTLNTTAAGGGSVILNPPGGTYPFGTVVQLSAVPENGNFFGYWGNPPGGNANPLNLVLTNANPTVSSLFGPVPGGQAALTVVPVGRGHVNISPRANLYVAGETVTIAAIPDAGQLFVGWSGDASGAINPLPLTLDANKLVFANFTERPQLTVLNSAAAIRNEGVRLQVTGSSGDRYELDSSTNFSNWTPLITLTNTFGTTTFTDMSAADANQMFYRLILLP
jgi:hypothetical protein